MEHRFRQLARYADKSAPIRSKLVADKNPATALMSPEDWIRVAQELRLTARELTITVMIFEGKTRRAIARKLKSAPGTVRVHIDRVFGKLNVRDRVGLVLRIVAVRGQLADVAS
jgi:DNA-binding NarL/FixJ family response regulator